MKEEDIRPEQLMRENKRLRLEDAKRLLENADRFEKIPCPACGSKNYAALFKKDGFNFVECGKCGTVFINPRPTLEMLSEFYATSKTWKHWNDKIFSSSEEARRKQIFIPRAQRVAELCRKHGAGKKALLDAGAGFGIFCEEIKRLSVFQKVVAVEPSHNLAETCRGKGIDVIEKPIEEVRPEDLGPEEISVVTSFELIEHLFSPKDFVESCARLLPKGGLFIITTPNIWGFDLLLLGEVSDNIAGPGHLNYFQPESLGLLLEKCGFEVIESITPGKLDAEIVRKKALSGEFDVSDKPFLKKALVDEWNSLGEAFQRFIAENGLSSHLWVVARRK